MKGGSSAQIGRAQAMVGNLVRGCVRLFWNGAAGERKQNESALPRVSEVASFQGKAARRPRLRLQLRLASRQPLRSGSGEATGSGDVGFSLNTDSKACNSGQHSAAAPFKMDFRRALPHHLPFEVAEAPRRRMPCSLNSAVKREQHALLAPVRVPHACYSNRPRRATHKAFSWVCSKRYARIWSSILRARERWTAA